MGKILSLSLWRKSGCMASKSGRYSSNLLSIFCNFLMLFLSRVTSLRTILWNSSSSDTSNDMSDSAGWPRQQLSLFDGDKIESLGYGSGEREDVGVTAPVPILTGLSSIWLPLSETDTLSAFSSPVVIIFSFPVYIKCLSIQSSAFSCLSAVKAIRAL